MQAIGISEKAPAAKPSVGGLVAMVPLMSFIRYIIGLVVLADCSAALLLFGSSDCSLCPVTAGGSRFPHHGFP